jgi:peptidoglycan/LPS O-acetylase OafA/YrhL
MLTRMVPEVYGDKHYYRYWSCWGSLLVVYSVLRLKYLQDFFTTRPLRYLGKVSFMLYLVHIPWMRIFSDRWHSALGGMDTFAGRQRLDWSDNLLWIPDIGPLGLNTRWFASLAATVPTTLFFADLATRYIDRPSVIAGERMAALVGLGREKSAAQQAALSDEDAAWRSRGGFLRRYIPFFRR